MVNLTFYTGVLSGLFGLLACNGGTPRNNSESSQTTQNSEIAFSEINTKGYFEDERNTGTFTAPRRDTTLKSSKPILSMLQDRPGNFWFATDGDGVFRYDGNSYAHFTEIEGLSDNYVRSMIEDNNGKLWFATREEGVTSFDGKSFKRYTIDNQNRINGSACCSLKDKNGNLWFGTSDGVYRYYGKSFTFLQLPMDAADVELRRSQPGFNLTAYSVYSLLEDKAGNIWFGTEQKGACRYDGKSFTWFREKGLDSVIRSIFQDKAGNIWFGTNGRGVICYDGNYFTNLTEEKGLGNPDFARTSKGKEGTLARVWTINEDEDGNLWFGTLDSGAWRYDGKSLKNITIKDGLGSNAVWSIFKDKRGRLWFGSDNGSFSIYDGKSFRHE